MGIKRNNSKIYKYTAILALYIICFFAFLRYIMGELAGGAR